MPSDSPAGWPPGFGPAEPLPDLSGHPTAPGPLDPDERQQRRRGAMQLGRRHGPGIPGMTPTGPVQPDAGWIEPS